MFVSKKKKKKKIMGTSCKDFLLWSLFKRRYGCVAVLFLFQVILIVLFALHYTLEPHSLLLYGHIFFSRMAYIFKLMAQLLIRPIQPMFIRLTSRIINSSHGYMKNSFLFMWWLFRLCFTQSLLLYLCYRGYNRLNNIVLS